MLSRKYIARRSISPWPELENFRRLANVFDSPQVRVRPTFPAINIWTNQEGAVIEAKLPNFNPEDIDISVEGETITIAGERTPEELEAGKQYLRRERRYGKFSRTFQLPFAIAADAVEADYEKGILRITLPRSEADKPKKIAVKPA